MADEFITLMADLDEQSQARMDNWYKDLRKEGFIGKQTPNLPFHISLASFSLENEQKAIVEMERISKEFSPIKVSINHIDIFETNNVLYCAIDSNDQLSLLKEEIKLDTIDRYEWTPHVTMLIDDKDTINKASKILERSFEPFEATITKLHLCAFWPTREIQTNYLKEK